MNKRDFEETGLPTPAPESEEVTHTKDCLWKDMSGCHCGAANTPKPPESEAPRPEKNYYMSETQAQDLWRLVATAEKERDEAREKSGGFASKLYNARGRLKSLQDAVEKALKKVYPSGGGSFPVELEDVPNMAIAEIPVFNALELKQALSQSRGKS